ncbi:Winged helix DNA-binding domain-containing protein [Frankia sp. EI5c]|nr:winged helix DNA-binding domain-containing protein [Frankia sp. EI5c]OAA23259.1 Winged helix DNA-binding domain-containing protein [Frankia sp. EI5c]
MAGGEAAELGRLLAEHGRAAGWGDRDPLPLANAARALLPLVQLPPRAVWGRSGRTVLTTTQAWLGRPLATATAPDEMVLRYLRAFGPATVADVQKWSGLTRLGEVVDRLRPRLLVLRDETGAELFDLPDAPRPGPDTPVPVRFLPEYDNVLLSYAAGTRASSEADRRRLFRPNGIIPATVLVDGFVRGVWKVARVRGAAVLEIEPFAPLTEPTAAELQAEGARLLAFIAADAPSRQVRLLRPAP